MRLAFLLHPKGVRIPFDPESIWTSSRGLTGSEVAYFKFAEFMSLSGHDVTLFSSFSSPGQFGTVRCNPYSEWENTYSKQNWDSACGWTMADPLFLASPGTFRFLNHQCNGFSTSPPGWENHVDLIAPLSHTHANRIVHETQFPRDKWRVLYNGVDTSKFLPGQKVPGKIIWASSLDRGLHWLLEMFPALKRAVPNAELHIFYDFHSVNYMSTEYVPGKWFSTPVHDELGNRSRYILEAVRKMERIGVHAHRSVSRDRIEEEMKNSSVLAYPLDPVYFTETFGVVVLEACASGTVPVICSDDAFGELWGSVAECVSPPFKDHKSEFFDKLVHILRDENYRSEVAQKCVQHSKKFEWSSLAKDFEL
jgi:glycosyltransferase involved in cell wall biosynthesis